MEIETSKELLSCLISAKNFTMKKVFKIVNKTFKSIYSVCVCVCVHVNSYEEKYSACRKVLTIFTKMYYTDVEISNIFKTDF